MKNAPADAGDVRDAGSILGSGRSPCGGHGSPLQCSCLENPMDRGAWWGYSPWGTELDKTKATWHASTVGGPGVAWRGCWWSALPTPKAVLSARGVHSTRLPLRHLFLLWLFRSGSGVFWPLCILLSIICHPEYSL